MHGYGEEAEEDSGKEQVYTVDEPMEFTMMDEIAHFLTGYGRMIFYKVYGYQTNLQGDSKDFNPYVDEFRNEISMIKEGEFESGLLNGYARVMGSDESVIAGFFKNGSAWGK